MDSVCSPTFRPCAACVRSYFNGKLVLTLEPTPTQNAHVSRDKVAAFKAWLAGDVPTEPMG